MGTEIERKFLVDEIKWKELEKGIAKSIVQGYLMKDPKRSVRIRISDDEACMTIKLGDAGLSRSEFEYTIPQADARLLLATIEKHIVKTRYKILYLGKTWDVDVFQGAHEGLIIAEIELSVEDEKFDIPDWVSKEVTGESSYYNANLV